jgi:beta-lactamase superfamily II metal-dependent hydrolase
MPVIKSFSVGHGDMFYIRHGSENFTIIDCHLNPSNKDGVIDEIRRQSAGKAITRFISTHPDEDHMGGLHWLDDALGIVNFYCVENQTTKADETDGFKRYKALRGSDKAFYLSRGVRRRFMNTAGEYGSAGLNVLWPKTDNEHYRAELQRAADGGSPNNISIILRYALEGGASVMWMGDLETPFMETIQDEIDLPKTNILFMPHHGRKSGKLPQKWIDQIDPDVLIKGEAHSKDSDYVSNPDRDKIHQNRAGDIRMDLDGAKVHFYVSSPTYCVDFLSNEGKSLSGYNYIGTLNL